MFPSQLSHCGTGFGIGRGRKGRKKWFWNCFQEIRSFVTGKLTHWLMIHLSHRDKLDIHFFRESESSLFSLDVPILPAFCFYQPFFCDPSLNCSLPLLNSDQVFNYNLFNSEQTTIPWQILLPFCTIIQYFYWIYLFRVYSCFSC